MIIRISSEIILITGYIQKRIKINIFLRTIKYDIVINDDVSSFKAYLDEFVEIYDKVSGNGIFNEIKPHVSEFLNLEKEYTSAVEFLK
ncbi:hypothetical protein POWCR01_130005400 [Plasmodium ovale]|uniref:PIR protein n=1 Tax=Plasmodium ovale TaxID=36330 RepID=A0A1C3KWJ6_PLAOA|nr:hypothetical protein POWCR01_130005400 [Plasmodium ovale]